MKLKDAVKRKREKEANISDIVKRLKEEIPLHNKVKEAIDKVRKDVNLSPDKVKGIYNRRIRSPSKNKKTNKIKKNLKLNELEKGAIVGTCLAFSLVNNGLTKSNLANIILHLHPEVKIGSARYQGNRILAENDNLLKLVQTKALNSARSNPNLVKYMEVFTQSINKWFNGSIPPTRLYNIDEFLVNPLKGVYRPKTIEAVGKGKNDKEEPKVSSVLSLVPIVSASGTCPIMYVIYPIAGDKDKKEDLTAKDVPLRFPANIGNTKIVVFFTHSGRVKKTTFSGIMKHFSDWYQTKYDRKEGVIMMDNLGAHHDLKMMQYARDVGLHCYYLPPNTTHILQPLDSYPFGILGNQISQWWNQKLVRSHEDANGIRKQIIVNMRTFFKKSFTKASIQGSWRDIGISPFCSEIILSKFIIEEKKQNKPSQIPKEVQLIINQTQKVIVDLLKNEREDRDIKGVDLKVQLDRPYDPEEFLIMIEEAEKAKEEAKKEKEARKEHNKSIRIKKLEARHALAEDNIKKGLAAKTKEIRLNYQSSKWINENCCSICKSKKRSNSKWTTSLCGMYVLCKTCEGLDGMWAKTHEAVCEACFQKTTLSKIQAADETNGMNLDP